MSPASRQSGSSLRSMQSLAHGSAHGQSRLSEQSHLSRRSWLSRFAVAIRRVPPVSPVPPVPSRVNKRFSADMLQRQLLLLQRHVYWLWLEALSRFNFVFVLWASGRDFTATICALVRTAVDQPHSKHNHLRRTHVCRSRKPPLQVGKQRALPKL